MNKVECPDCNETMIKTSIECDDGSGWYVGWLCECESLEAITQ